MADSQERFHYLSGICHVSEGRSPLLRVPEEEKRGWQSRQAETSPVERRSATVVGGRMLLVVLAVHSVASLRAWSEIDRSRDPIRSQPVGPDVTMIQYGIATISVGRVNGYGLHWHPGLS